MSEGAGEREDEGYREPAPNPTQERIDREGGGSNAPADAAWREDDWGATETRDGD